MAMRTTAVVLFLAIIATGAFCAEPVDDLVVLEGKRPLPCRVAGIGKDGNILLRGAPFVGDVRVPLQGAASITLKRSADEKGADVVMLSNGNYLIGDVKDISTESVTLVSSTLGTIELPRASVVQVRFGRKSDARSLHSDFALGLMAPWKPLSGDWHVVDGWLKCADKSDQDIAAPLEQDGPTTYDFKLNFAMSHVLGATFTLFADSTARSPRTEHRRGKTSITVSFAGAFIPVSQMTKHGPRPTGSGRTPNALQRRSVIDIRIAYDPGDGRLHVWGNGELLVKHKLSNPTKTGKFVILRYNYRRKIRTLSAVPGFHIPEKTVPVEGPTTQDTVALRLGVTPLANATCSGDVRLTDGEVLIGTAQGEAKYAAKDVAHITFREKDRHTPEPAAQDAVVMQHRSRITVVPATMDATTLTGRSPTLGEVKLNRATITCIKLPEPAASPPGPHTIALKTGLVLSGAVLDIGRDGKVRFHTPLIDGVAAVPSTHVKRLGITTAIKAASPLALVLTNGDRVAGELLEIAEDAIVMDSPAAGNVEVSRPMARYITATAGPSGTVWSDFTGGIMAPWRIKRGKVILKGGALQTTAEGSREGDAVSLEIKQEGPMTYQIEVDRGTEKIPRASLWVRADGWKKEEKRRIIYRNALHVFASPTGYYASAYVNDRRQSSPRENSKPTPGNISRATFTLVFDPEAEALSVWTNSTLLGTFREPKRGWPAGSEVTINVIPGMRILRASVRPGAHLPAKKVDLPGYTGQVEFWNGDSVFVKQGLSVDDERLTMFTPHGELRCPLKNVARINLPVGKTAKPRSNKTDARVRIGQSTLTMQITEMTETTLRGRSDYLGEVRLPRKLLRSIEFGTATDER